METYLTDSTMIRYGLIQSQRGFHVFQIMFHHCAMRDFSPRRRPAISVGDVIHHTIRGMILTRSAGFCPWSLSRRSHRNPTWEFCDRGILSMSDYIYRSFRKWWGGMILTYPFCFRIFRYFYQPAIGVTPMTRKILHGKSTSEWVMTNPLIVCQRWVCPIST